MLHSVHPSFLIWSAVLGAAVAVILAAFLGPVVRRHLKRLAASLAIGAAAALAVTGWADSHRHAQLAAAAHSAHPVSVAGQLVPAFTVITVVVAAVAFAVFALVARRQATRSYYAQNGQYAPSRRGW